MPVPRRGGLTARLLPGLLAVTMLTTRAGIAAAAPGAKYPVQVAYTRPGPYATTTSVVTGSNGQAIYDLYHPRNYGALRFKSPIVTWGNGTAATPRMYSTLLSHLASYGFTVIASTSPMTGSGTQIDAAARYLVAQDGTRGSVFYRRLDVHHVAAVGHSQGAGGAVKAAIGDPTVITAVMTFSLPVTLLLTGPSTARLTQPTFFISTHGPFDAVIAPPWAERTFYRRVTVHAALGIIRDSDGKRADHTSVQDAAHGGNPGGLLGYATAWLEDQLRGNATARRAFTGAHPELVSNTNWPGSAVK
jgi:hypothetical protein